MASASGSRSKAKLHRVYALDSLRGIAALVVFFQHSALMIPEDFRAQLSDWVTFNPLRIFFNGTAAVLLFFVLSGYVLSLSFYGINKPSYIGFLVKRVCRIYLPFAFAILFSALLYVCSEPSPQGLGSEACRLWWPTGSLTWTMVVQQLAMIGTVNQMWLDSPVWSLIHELRISIIFPVLIFVCGYKKCAALSVLFIVIGAPMWAINNGQDWSLDTATTFAQTFLITLRFIPFFILGIILGKYDRLIRAWAKALSRIHIVSLVALALFLLYLPTDIPNSLPEMRIVYHYSIQLILGIVSGFLIVIARYSPGTSALLTLPPFKWLGKISYSLYLMHVPVMLFIFRSIVAEASIPIMFLAVYGAVFMTSALFFLLIEQPSLTLGNRLAKAIDGRSLRRV